jgi:hypothetical protein
VRARKHTQKKIDRATKDIIQYVRARKHTGKKRYRAREHTI